MMKEYLRKHGFGVNDSPFPKRRKMTDRWIRLRNTVAEKLKDGCFYFAWLLRHEAFLRFKYDPDAVFSEKTGECGFRE